jgi:hypothetical protein
MLSRSRQDDLLDAVEDGLAADEVREAADHAAGALVHVAGYGPLIRFPHKGLSTLGSDPARFQTKPPAC